MPPCSPLILTHIRVGVYCSGCACRECLNTLENQDLVHAERSKKLAASPGAFAPKVGEVRSSNTAVEQLMWEKTSHPGSRRDLALGTTLWRISWCREAGAQSYAVAKQALDIACCSSSITSTKSPAPASPAFALVFPLPLRPLLPYLNSAGRWS